MVVHRGNTLETPRELLQRLMPNPDRLIQTSRDRSVRQLLQSAPLAILTGNQVEKLCLRALGLVALQLLIAALGLSKQSS